METIEILKRFLKLQHQYEFTRRSMITKERFKDIAKGQTEQGLDIHNETLNEPLIEHMGHLPIIASFFHEHIEHSSTVNHGKVLIMLSVHDIGETKVGDTFTFTKTAADVSEEVAAA